MSNQFTAVYERDEDWYIGYCLEVPGANGQGKTKEECRESLREAIKLILEDRRQDGLRGLPSSKSPEDQVPRFKAMVANCIPRPQSPRPLGRRPYSQTALCFLSSCRSRRS